MAPEYFSQVVWRHELLFKVKHCHCSSRRQNLFDTIRWRHELFIQSERLQFAARFIFYTTSCRHELLCKVKNFHCRSQFAMPNIFYMLRCCFELLFKVKKCHCSSRRQDIFYTMNWRHELFVQSEILPL